MIRILVDTDVLIDFTKGHDESLGNLLSTQTKGKLILCTTPVNVAEFLTDSQLEEREKEHKAREFLSFFSTCDITKAIGILAGMYLRKKQSIFLGDALIAACCVEGELLLATRNRRHFSSIPKLQFYDAL